MRNLTGLAQLVLSLLVPFKDNYMRLNREKCHFMVFGDKCNDLTIQIEAIPNAENREQKLLGITVDKKPAFKYVRRQIKNSMLFLVFRAI